MAGVRRRPSIGAAVDIGSYSVHLLVAEVRGHRVDAHHDESAFLGLGRSIDAEGRLGGARRELVSTLASYAARARELGAVSLTIVGTDPLRRAADAGAAIDEIQGTTGAELAVLSHEEEALVALLGVQAGRPVTRETVVVDVGGGSTEVLVAHPHRVPIAVGLPLGATRLTGRHVRHDPPTWLELEALTEEAVRVMRGAPPAEPLELIAVGGTARSLLRVGPPLANRALSRRRIRRALDLIAAAPAQSIADHYSVRLSRVKVLPAGAAILLGALEQYHLNRLRVARGGLREGLILAAYHAGPNWREQIGALALGWDDQG
jgi:exopolyphosphatase/guanosine-5'-triphosphate,3'-diphosphate pyrophosphatase